MLLVSTHYQLWCYLYYSANYFTTRCIVLVVEREVPYFSLLKTMKSLWTLSNRCCNCPFWRRDKHRTTSASQWSVLAVLKKQRPNLIRSLVIIFLSYRIRIDYIKCRSVVLLSLVRDITVQQAIHTTFCIYKSYFSFRKMPVEEIDLTLEDT